MEETRESNLTDNFSCHKCGEPGFKSDGESKVWCEKCLDKAMHCPPIVRVERPGTSTVGAVPAESTRSVA